MRLSLATGLCLCLTILSVCAQEEDDSTRINPEQCGRRVNNKGSSERRFLSSVKANQKDFGWHVCVLDSEPYHQSGSLINSQWVLSRALDIK
jgi:hypothetical protein